MSTETRWGFHSGELAVQERSGLAEEAARLEGMLAPHDLSGGLGMFLATQSSAWMTTVEADGRPWTTLLTGPPGFLAVDGSALQVSARVGADQFADLVPGASIGLLVMDLVRRRRVRVNGHLREATGDGLFVEVREVFGNCPSYIHPRATAPAGTDQAAIASTPLPNEVGALVRAADMFVVGTWHPERGADTSHKGGAAGFLRTNGTELWWPDYAGNNMFNSLGNIASTGVASLWIPDFASGTALQVSGPARVEWGPTGAVGDDGKTGRRVVLAVEKSRVSADGLLQVGPKQVSPDVPELSQAAR